MKILQITASGVTNKATYALGDLLSLITAASDNGNEDEVLTLTFPYLELPEDNAKPVDSKDVFYLCGEYLPDEELKGFFDQWCPDVDVREVSPVDVVRFWLVESSEEIEPAQGLVAVLPCDVGFFDRVGEKEELSAELLNDDSYPALINPVRQLTRDEVADFLAEHPDHGTDTFDLEDDSGQLWTLAEIVAEWANVNN